MEKSKIKIWKIILIIVIILLILFIINTGRKMFIIKEIQNKVSKYTKETEYYIKSCEFRGDSLSIAETYKKNNRSLSSITNLSRDTVSKLTNVNDNGIITTYLDTSDTKIIIPNSNGLPSYIEVSDMLYTENIWQFIIRAMKSSIDTEECNGKECYKIQVGCFNPLCFDKHKEDLCYFDKETGLCIRRKNGTEEKDNEKTNCIIDYHYEFKMVDDENLKVPNINEYKIQENNS